MNVFTFIVQFNTHRPGLLKAAVPLGKQENNASVIQAVKASHYRLSPVS